MSQLLNLEEATQALKEGKLVGVPTETVYGLAANALNEKAVAKIFSVKKRPKYNPLICHFSETRHVFDYGRGEKIHQRLAHFWPGPMTLLLKHEGNLPSIICAGLSQAAYRVPDHDLLRKLIQKCNFPLAAPSANISNQQSPTTAQMVLEDIGKQIAGVLDGGHCKIGIESTILQNKGKEIEILRPGGLSREQIKQAGFSVKMCTKKTEQKPLAPGQLSRHYSPKLPMILLLSENPFQNYFITEKLKRALHKHNIGPEKSCYISFGKEKAPAGFASYLNFSLKGDLTEAGENFFRTLDKAAKLTTNQIIITHYLPNHGIGFAINDRLRRGSSFSVSLP